MIEKQDDFPGVFILLTVKRRSGIKKIYNKNYRNNGYMKPADTND
jgi:hypothetical protein